MAKTHWLAVDFDWTLWESRKQVPMEGAREAMQQFRERGFKILVHSCNNPGFIRDCLERSGIPFDAIWGELPGLEGQKPVCDCYVDDRAFHFNGNWAESVPRIIEQVLHRDANPKNG